MKSSRRARSSLSDVAIIWQKMTMKGTKGETRIALCYVRINGKSNVKKHLPMHIRTLKDLIVLPYSTKAHLMMFKCSSSCLHTFRYECAG
jgi:hypothetical protein